MTVTEVKHALGRWNLRLKPNTPREILSRLTFYGHIAILPGKLEPEQFDDNLLRSARYVGVYRKKNEFTLSGSGMAFWLGDEDDKGDVFETAVELTNATFADAINALLPVGGAIVAGTIHSVPGTYTGKHQWETPRKALTYVAETFGAEWRVNGDGTLDAGAVSDLYVTTPRALIVRKDFGDDLQRKALPGQMSMEVDVEDVTTRVVLLAEGEGDAIATGTADAPATPFKDIHGNPIKATRLISESATSSDNAEARAQLQLNRFLNAKRSVDLSTSEYDVKGTFVVGDYVDVYDPDLGFVDTNREVYWKGSPIYPMALRCVEMTWPVPAGWTVAFRDIDGNWIDLSQYYEGEAGDTTIVVGELPRGLSTPAGEPISFRPNLPPPAGADTTIPGAPTFTGFSTGSYQSGTTNTTKAAILAQWTTPTNLDGSTITDGDHYEIRYRTNHYIGYRIKWGKLSGYQEVFSEAFPTIVFDGWGAGWVTGGGSPSNYGVSDGVGFHISDMPTMPKRTYRSSVNVVDGVLVFDVSTDTLASDATQYAAGMLRNDGSDDNMYMGQIRFNTDQTIEARIVARVGASESIVATQVVPDITHSINTWYRVKFMVIGDKLRLKIWPRDWSAEPTEWIIDTTSTAITGSGTVGVRSLRNSGSTSGTTKFSYDNIRLINLQPNNGYDWDDIEGNKWGAPVSEPVSANPQWETAYVGWGTNEFTIQELTPGMTYELQIRAVDNAMPPHAGPWSDSSFVATIGDIFPPSTPAPPIVASSMIAIQVTHNLGKNSGGAFNLENDIDHLDVHVGGSDAFYPDETNKVGVLIATAGMLQGRIPAVGTFKIDQTDNVWVRVVAVDRAGNKSAPSPAVQSTAQLIDDAHISNLSVSKVTAGTITATWLMAGAIKTAETGKRVEISGNGIRAFNANGLETVNIDGDLANLRVTEGRLEVIDNFGRTIVEIGKTSDGRYGLRVNDSSGAAQIRAGQLSGSGYGLEAINEFGELVDLGRFIFNIKANTVFAIEQTNSTDWVDLPTPGPSVTVEIGSTGRVRVDLSAGMGAPQDGRCAMSFAMSGANNAAPEFWWALEGPSPDFNGPSWGRVSRMVIVSGLNPGPTTFTAKYCDGSGQGGMCLFTDRHIAVMPL